MANGVPVEPFYAEHIASPVVIRGGMLSHAATVGREYGVLTVGDGDQIEVDGPVGRVTILKRAAEPAEAGH